MQNRMELLSCLKSIARAKEKEARPAAAGCARTVRSGKERPLQPCRARGCSFVPVRSVPGPARPSAAAAAPGCPVLRARFTCTLSSRTFGKIRASFHSCFYVQPTSGRRDPASSTLLLIGFGRCGLAVGPLIDCREHWRQEKKESVLRRRVGGGTG